MPGETQVSFNFLNYPGCTGQRFSASRRGVADDIFGGQSIPPGAGQAGKQDRKAISQ